MTIQKDHFRRLQINKAVVFLKSNLHNKLTLSEIAEKSGASQYHFIRLFSSYTGETPFSFIARERIVRSLTLLQAVELAVIDIAFESGFESSSAYNKAFKRVTSFSPTEFRNMGKDEQDATIYNLSMTPKTKEIIMNFKMELNPVIINRGEVYIHTSKASGGEFKDVAPIAWEHFLKCMESTKADLSQSEFLGVGTMSTEDTTQVCTYKAAVTSNLDIKIDGLEKEILPASKYAKFLLKGSYDNLWIAFDKAFQIINEGPYEFSNTPCIENYLNDPSVTPVEDLLTEILIPIE
jgi:AraC family transcriptional regulator